MLEMGPIEQSIARQAMRAGNKLPERIANAPQVQPHLIMYLQAFFDLDSERSHALVPTSIPWSSIKGYAEAYNFDEEETEELLFFIRKMDTSHLERVAKQMKAN
jgi:hypothetical protein